MPRMTLDEAIDHALGLQERHPGRWVSQAHPNNRQYLGEDGGKWLNILHRPGGSTSLVVRVEGKLYDGEPVYRPLTRADDVREIERLCSALGLPKELLLEGMGGAGDEVDG